MGSKTLLKKQMYKFTDFDNFSIKFIHWFLYRHLRIKDHVILL